MIIKTFCMSDVGGRTTNDDTASIYQERGRAWVYVGDGLGSYAGGKRASKTAGDALLTMAKQGSMLSRERLIEAAAKAVSADTVVSKLEKGWDSDVGEGGDRLSTGEKQLISFARAVLADPRIFVLDEATSSIDTQTEQLIQNAIDHLLQDRTSFLIAHRLSTIRKADLILVVKDGKIVEQGNHKELLKKKGYYHALYTRQYEDEATARILS